MNFTVKDCAGITHSINLSTDRRGLAYDAMPRSMSRRPRVAPDQELDDLFSGLDEETAYAIASELLDRFPDLKDRLDRDNGGTSGTGTGEDRRRARDAKSAGSSLAAQDSALAAKRRMANREDTFSRFPALRRIGGA